jgi:enoyl reductase-like protein
VAQKVIRLTEGADVVPGSITGSNVANNTLSNTWIGLAASASNSVTSAVTTTSTSAYSTVNSLSFTPAKTGKVLVIARMIVNNNTAGDGVSVELLNGSTVVDGPYTLISSAASQNQSVTLMALLSGLTVGTAYTFSTAIEAVTGGTASAVGVLVAMELLA